MRFCVGAWLSGICLLTAVTMADSTPAPDAGDSRVQAANEWVGASDRYLHHSKLRRGMTGYGLTVLEGTKIVRFEVEIISVMRGFRQPRDVILARLHGQNLEHTGVISGMSGSPVYIRDGEKDKMIGAVAFNWGLQKVSKDGPVCGIQPIAQMLAAVGVGSEQADTAETAPAHTSAAGRGGVAALSPEWLAVAMDPRKLDFSRFGWPKPPESPAGAASSVDLRMQPVATPLMLNGLGDRASEILTRALEGHHLVPMQAGGIMAGVAEEIKDLKLAPGSSLAIPLVTGDMSMTALGTATEVIGDRVIGFGHAMYGNGTVRFPMATGYVHTVIPNLSSSFKLGDTVRIVGELTSDEFTAVGGTMGRPVDMIPVSVQMQWDRDARKHTYDFQILRDRSLTPLLAFVTTLDALWSSRRLPLEHSVAYSVAVDFGPLGRYQVSNFSAGADLYYVASDLTRPLALLLNNPFGMARVHSVSVTARVSEGVRLANLRTVTTDRNVYAPGETVRATATFRRFKGPRFSRTIELPLPEDLPEGRYALRVGDWEMAMQGRRRREPRIFDPQSLAELFLAVQRVADLRMDRLYAVLELTGEDVVVDTQTLADAPPTIAEALKAVRPVDVWPRGRAVTVELPMQVVVQGRNEKTIVVEKEPARP